MPHRFIVERVDTKTGERTYARVEKRPTQAELRDRGLASYTLRRPDGSVVKRYQVTLNRNGNPRVTAETPVNLEGISTLNLERMNRAFERIVRHWPAKAADVRKIDAEISARQGFAVTNGDTEDTPFPDRAHYRLIEPSEDSEP